MRVEFDLRESLNTHAPDESILLYPSSSEFDLRKSLNEDAASRSIEFFRRWSVLRVEFDLRELFNTLAPSDSQIEFLI